MRSGLLVAFACLAIWPSTGLPQTSTIRVGHFPNITHVQGLVAHHLLTRHGRGWFEQWLGRT
jgi:NitT/TauT family transport system substrate-binding protein